MTAPAVKGIGKPCPDKAGLSILPKAKLIAMILEQREDTRIRLEEKDQQITELSEQLAKLQGEIDKEKAGAIRGVPAAAGTGDLFNRVDRRALRADLHPATQPPPARVDVHADPHRRGPGAQHRLDRVEVLAAVDHHDRRPLRVGDRAQREVAERPDVGRRIGEQQILVTLLGQPQGLRQGEGQKARETLVALKYAIQEARQRSDLLATRTGFSPARPSISSALDHIASRSTKANGASTSSKISSKRACD